MKESFKTVLMIGKKSLSVSNCSLRKKIENIFSSDIHGPTA